MMNMFRGLFLLLLSGLVWADAFYSVTVPVADESAEQRQQALPQAFKQVLIKTSGSRRFQGQTLSQLLKKAPQWVQQFRYQRDEQGHIFLWVQFDQQAVQKALQKLGLSIWRSGRPDVLIWIAIQADQDIALFDPEEDKHLMQSLQRVADQRGVPLLFPLMDLEDHQQIQAQDIAQQRETVIRLASARYGAPVILSLYLQADRQNWRLYFEQDSLDFSTQGADLYASLQEGMNLIADEIARRYRPQLDQDSHWVELQISGINDFQDYAWLMQLLQRLDVQKDMRISQVSLEQLVIKLKVKGGLPQLQQQLDLVPRLERMAVGADVLSYQLY